MPTSPRPRPPRQFRPLCTPREPPRDALRCQRKIDVPGTPTPRPATAMGRHSCRAATVRAGPRAGQAVPADRARADRRSLTTNLARDVSKTKARRVLLRTGSSTGYSLLREGYRSPVGERLIAGGHASGTPIAVSPSGFPGFAVTIVGAIDPG